VKQFIALLVMSVAITACAGAQKIQESIVRIGIVQNAASLNISGDNGYYLYEMNTGKCTDLKTNDDYLVRCRDGNIYFNGTYFSAPVRLVPNDSTGRVRVNGRRYRDSIMLTCKKDKLTAINELGIENYLYGILPREVNPKWNAEALKAQAVVSRTYALRNMRRHMKEGFDLCAQTHCQVYGGVESEDLRTTTAVNSTCSEVLTFDGALAQTLFHASCGGHTENPDFVWIWERKSPSYLSGRRDTFCADSPHNAWKNLLSPSLIRTRLTKAGYPVGEIKNISAAGGKDASGRTKLLKITHGGGTLTIPAPKFRLAVDPWLIKSVFFTGIVRYRDGYEFRGKGWGHGVGMCQWGAKSMAEKNYNYHEILHYYYPGATVEKWED